MTTIIETALDACRISTCIGDCDLPSNLFLKDEQPLHDLAAVSMDVLGRD